MTQSDFTNIKLSVMAINTHANKIKTENLKLSEAFIALSSLLLFLNSDDRNKCQIKIVDGEITFNFSDNFNNLFYSETASSAK